MDKAFEREGIGSMLKRRDRFLYVTHEHFDHFFGIESVLSTIPKIKVIAPNTFYDRDIACSRRIREIEGKKLHSL